MHLSPLPPPPAAQGGAANREAAAEGWGFLDRLGFIQALGGLMLGQIALFSVQSAAARPLALAPPYPSTSALSASSALAMAACA